MIERGVLYIVDASSNSVKQYISVLLKHLNRARYSPYLVISSDKFIAERLRESSIQYVVVPEIATANKFNVGSIAGSIIESAGKRMFNLVHSHDYQGCFVASHVSKTLGIPHINTVYKPLDGNAKKKGLFVVQNDKIVSMPDHLIAVSNEVKTSVDSLNKVSIIHNAIEAERFAETLDMGHLQRELGLKKKNILIGTVTNLTSDEKIETVLQIAKALIDKDEQIHFAIAGTGQNNEILKAKAREMRISGRIHFLGYRRDVAHVLKSLSVVLVLETDPGIPLVLLEALASIRPVVAMDSPGIREVATEESVTFAKSGDASTIVAAVRSMLKDMTKAAEKASAGQKTVTDLFSVDGMIKPTQSLYLQIAG